MYSIVSHTDVIDREKRRRIVDVTFTNGQATFVQAFSFSVDTELAVIKRTVKDFLDDLNFVPPVISDFTPVADPEPVPPTAAELAKAEWEADFAKLEKVKRLIDCGALTGSETAIVALRNKVKTDFKPAYLS